MYNLEIACEQPKFPSEYFMDWLRAKLNDKSIRLNFFFKDEPYLSDAFIHKEYIYETEKEREGTPIEEDYEKKHWTPEKIILISAQTGKGKNYFVFEKMQKELIEKFPNENNLILLISNRIGASRQNKKQVAELLVKFSANGEHKKI